MKSGVYVYIDDVEIEYNLLKLDIVSQYLKPKPIDFDDSNTLIFNIDIHNSFNKSEQYLIMTVTINISDKLTQLNYAMLVSELTFEFYGLIDWYRTKGIDNGLIPFELHAVLNEIAISTTRGLMYATFKGTWLPNITLMVIDPELVARIVRNKV